MAVLAEPIGPNARYCSDLSLFLFGDPGEMPGQIRVGFDGVQGCQRFGQCHFIIKIMDTIMTKPADKNAGLQVLPGIFFLKKFRLSTFLGIR